MTKPTLTYFSTDDALHRVYYVSNDLIPSFYFMELAGESKEERIFNCGSNGQRGRRVSLKDFKSIEPPPA